jgi:hypothetical protein
MAGEILFVCLVFETEEEDLNNEETHSPGNELAISTQELQTCFIAP